MTTLLMTGTIRPQAGARELSRTAVEDRLEDYRLGLKHNVRLLRRGDIGGVVFVENSGYGVERFADLVGDPAISDRVELISYRGAQPPGQTRFAGECHLLRHAFRHSRLIRADTEGYLWKITGRYTVVNLVAIVRGSEGLDDLILHCRDYPIPYVDFGLVGFRATHAEEIVDRILATPGLDDLDERMIRQMLDEGRFADMKVRSRFSRVPNFRGVRGSDSASYGGLKYQAQFGLRSVVHRLAPAVWL